LSDRSGAIGKEVGTEAVLAAIALLLLKTAIAPKHAATLLQLFILGLSIDRFLNKSRTSMKIGDSVYNARFFVEI
jgi:hypothetical protein